MSTNKAQTLADVREALLRVEEQRAGFGLTRQEKMQLERTCVALTNLEDALVHASEDELVAKLHDDAEALEELVVQMDQSALRLTNLAATVEKAAKAVGGLIKVLGRAGSAGLIG